MKKKIISIDSTNGGNGDFWMRLVSYYVISVLRPEVSFEIKIPGFLFNLAAFTFGDRLKIISDKDYICEYNYTNLGIKDLVKSILKGKKFISPYARAVIHDKKEKAPKDYINLVAYRILDMLGVVQLPNQKWTENYQGYLDIIGLKQIRSISYESYLAQLKKDYPDLLLKFQKSNIPLSPELTFPKDFEKSVVIFPTGTGRQFVPVWWAKKYLPDAYYAFFIKDKDASIFIENNLKVVYFYKEPGDIIALSKAAGKTLSTDSFPSHLLQYATSNCIITLTELLKSRIITPFFKGQVIENQVACHPCLHIEKSQNCAAGYKECLNWKNTVYTENILNNLK
jgi:hypothetical protein